MIRHFLATRSIAFSAVIFLALSSPALRSPAADEPKPAAAAEDLRQMQGEWTVVSSERDGQAAAPSEFASVRRKVSGNKVEIEIAGQEGIATLVSEFTLDALKEPKTIDVVRKDGPTAGVATLAIYDFQDGNLRICAAPPGQPRPTMFATTTGAGVTLIVWKRAEPLADGPGGQHETRALDVLKNLSERIRNAESVQTSATLTTTIREGDRSRGFEVAAKIAARRPGKFSFWSQVDGAEDTGLTIVADGDSLTTFINDRNQFTKVEGKTSLSQVSETLLQLGHVNTGVLFANLLNDDPYQTLLGGVTRCVYAGIEQLDGAPFHYLRFKQDQLSWELWVAAEGEPLVRRLVSRNAPNANADGDNAGGPTIVTVEEYRDWKLDDEVAEDEFHFTPPADAKRVDDFRAAN